VRDIVLTQVGPPEAEDAELVARARRRNERVAQLYLDRLRTRLWTAQCAPRVAVLHGEDVADRLAELVRKDSVDLVVMADGGASVRRERDGVAVSLIARSLVPLLLVRPRPAKSRGRVAQPERAAIAPRLPIPAAS
jgi:nucleotide-binding universal stress UspA family protein